jgi:hypothetical protein
MLTFGAPNFIGGATGVSADGSVFVGWGNQPLKWTATDGWNPPCAKTKTKTKSKSMRPEINRLSFRLRFNSDGLASGRIIWH